MAKAPTVPALPAAAPGYSVSGALIRGSGTCRCDVPPDAQTCACARWPTPLSYEAGMSGLFAVVDMEHPGLGLTLAEKRALVRRGPIQRTHFGGRCFIHAVLPPGVDADVRAALLAKPADATAVAAANTRAFAHVLAAVRD